MGEHGKAGVVPDAATGLHGNDAATNDGPHAAGSAQAIISRAGGDPRAIAAALQTNPAAHDEVMTYLNQTLGAGFAREVRQSLGPATGGSTQAMRVTASQLNVRSGPSKSDHLLGTLNHQAVVESTGQEGAWRKIDYAGKAAFAFAEYLQPVASEAAPVAPHHHAPEHVPEAASSFAAPVAEAGPVAPTAPVAHAAPLPVEAVTPHADPIEHEDPKPVAAPPSQAPAHHDAASPTTQHAPASHDGGAQAAPAAAPIAHVAPTDHAQAPETAHVDPARVDAVHATAGAGYLANFTSLGGTNLADLKTTKAEATILNEIRASDKRFNPAWLAKAQTTLGVTALGAFNTETLRALEALHPGIDAKTILGDQGGVMSSLAPGEAFIETDKGTGTANPHSMIGATKADQAAHALGYANYAAYSGTFGSAMFLGVPLNEGQGSGLAHPHLMDRLAVAETWLRQHYPGKSDPDIVAAIGWSGKGNAAYADNTKAGVSHFHTMGLAIDIDVQHNPYVFTGRDSIKDSDDADTKKTKGQKNWWMDMFEKHMAYAAKIFGGDPVSASTMNRWSASMSTDELWAKITEMSSSFKSYMDLAAKSDHEIRTAFTDAHINAPAADLAEMKHVPGYFHDNYSRSQAASLTNHSQELLVALRDVAGLSWGGAEMSGNENGDFMHFDCRQDGFGKVLQSFNFP